MNPGLIILIAVLALVVGAQLAALVLELRATRVERDRIVARLAELEAVSTLATGPSLVGKTVVVNTRKPDDQTIRGVLHGEYADRWTLRDAVYVTGVGETPAAKLVHVPLLNLAFAQEIEA